MPMFNINGQKNKHYVEISPSIVIFTALFLLASYFIYRIMPILVLLFMSFIIMLALKPAVDKVQKRIKNRLASIVVVYVSLIVLLITMITFMVPPLVKQLYQLIMSIDYPLIQEQLNQFEFTLVEISGLINTYSGSVAAIFSLITSTFSGIFTIFTLLVLSLYLMFEHDKLYLKASWFSKEARHIKIAKEFLLTIEEQLGGWVRGELILMSIIGLLTYFGMLIFRMPFALPLALLAGLLEVLPSLGPTIAAVPAIAIAYFYTNPTTTILVVIFCILIQQFENDFIVPKVMQKNANVNPLIAISAVLSGFKIGGVIGALLAVPSYIVLRTTFSYWWKYRKEIKEVI